MSRSNYLFNYLCLLVGEVSYSKTKITKSICKKISLEFLKCLPKAEVSSLVNVDIL